MGTQNTKPRPLTKRFQRFLWGQVKFNKDSLG